MVMRIVRGAMRRLFGVRVPAIPIRARHTEYSALVSADDAPGRPSERLIDLALRAAGRARSASMESVIARMKTPPYFPNVWPGEHYKLLAGLVAERRPQLVVEIGTDTGLSALAMHPCLPEGARLVTFDIIPWDRIPGTCLRPEDFAGGTLSQEVGDVSDPGVMRRHAALFREADLIFLDGPKDGRFERVVLDRFTEIGLPRQPLVVMDDIRVWNMLAIWRDIERPKLDMTSFGHWTGTGLVDWAE